MSICPFTNFAYNFTRNQAIAAVSKKEQEEAAKNNQPLEINDNNVYYPKTKTYKYLALKHFMLFTGACCMLSIIYPLWLCFVSLIIAIVAYVGIRNHSNDLIKQIQLEEKNLNYNKDEEDEIDENFIKSTQKLALHWEKADDHDTLVKPNQLQKRSKRAE